MSKTLYGVGVGPGDSELLTLKALRCIRESDIIILPSRPKEECYAYRIVKEVYPQIDEKEIVCMPFPMTRDQSMLKRVHHEIYEGISKLLGDDKTAAFLTIGDPSVYSTYAYIHEKVIEEGGTAVMINGVTSFCAAAAAIGIPLGKDREEIHIIPAACDIRPTLKLNGTKIYMKSGKNLAELKKVLSEYANLDHLEVYAVSNCGMINETVRIGINNLDGDSGYLTVVIVKGK